MTKPVRDFAFTAPSTWLGRDGEPLPPDISRQLGDSLMRLHEQCRQTLEEAAQMGVSVDFAKIVMTDMIHMLERPNRNFSEYYN